MILKIIGYEGFGAVIRDEGDELMGAGAKQC